MRLTWRPSPALALSVVGSGLPLLAARALATAAALLGSSPIQSSHSPNWIGSRGPWRPTLMSSERARMTVPSRIFPDSSRLSASICP